MKNDLIIVSEAEAKTDLLIRQDNGYCFHHEVNDVSDPDDMKGNYTTFDKAQLQ